MSEKIDLKVGDKVRLLDGGEWKSYGLEPGTVVTVESVIDGAAWGNSGAGALTSIGGAAIPNYPIEKVIELPDESDLIQPTEGQLNAFQQAWRAADKLGLTGQRTRAGLIAALNYKEA